MEYDHQLSELKRLILLKSKIRFITPADCKRISIEISKRLNKNVSETTVKRLFGFAAVKHRFSNFTLTTLAEYVDSEKNEHGILPAVQHNPDEWKSVKEKIDKITRFTLKTIKNRSGIPYELTISRRFAEHDFDEFYKGNYIFTSLISQPGYGRTTLLAHLAENLFFKDGAAYQDSTLLFISAPNFFNLDQLNLNLEDQIKQHLGLTTTENILEFLNRNQQSQSGKFIIIFDGLSELVIKRDQKNDLFDSIINLICSLEDYKNIKLMMSMRSTTWVRFYERMRYSSFLKSKWFPGNYFNMHELSNVPPLSEKEVDVIISRINTSDSSLNPRLKAQLKFPFHIQLYYQLKEEDPDFNYYSNITFYELVSRFIQEKIYRSNYYTEKILFLKKIIQLTGYGKDSSSVVKDHLLTELSVFKNAYMELLSDGILMEERRIENAHPVEYVRFLHTHMFEYFLFVEILEKFHLQVSLEFFQFINTQYDANQVRFQLLQWTARFLIKTGNFSAIRSIFRLDLINYEVNYLILFIAEEIKYRSKHNSDIERVLDDHLFHEIIIDELINFDFIDSCYKEAVTALVDIAQKDDHLLVYNSLLGLIEIFSMDKQRIIERADHMRKLKGENWMFNPVDALDIIYAKINSVPVTDSRLITQIADFKEGKNTFNIDPSSTLSTQQGIAYLMMLFVDIFTGHHNSIPLFDSMAKLQPKLFTHRTSFTLFIVNLYGYNLAFFNPGGRANQIERLMVHLINKRHTMLTKYIESITSMLQAQQSFNRKEYEIAIDHAKECLSLFKRNNMIFNAMVICDLLISIYIELRNEGLANEYRYERLCMLDVNEISKTVL